MFIIVVYVAFQLTCHHTQNWRSSSGHSKFNPFLFPPLLFLDSVCQKWSENNCGEYPVEDQVEVEVQCDSSVT